MLPYRAPLGRSTAPNQPDAPPGTEKRVPSVAGRRVVSQGLARTQQRSASQLATSTLQVDNTSFEEWMKMATDNVRCRNVWVC